MLEKDEKVFSKDEIFFCGKEELQPNFIDVLKYHFIPEVIIDIEKAFTAGLLHDCAKCYTNEQLLYYCLEYQIEINEYEQASPYLLHSKLGAYFAKNKYGIEDEDIINAILFHTTGRPNMSKLEEIIFIADCIEPYRNRADNLDIIRKLAYKDIKKAILKATQDTLDYLRKKGKEQFIDALSVQTYEYYKEQCRE